MREQPQRASKERDRGRDHDPAESQCDSEYALVAALGKADNDVVALVNFAAQHERAEHRHQGEREQQRAAEREHHRERHRMKHFSLDTRQRENRDIDNRDDDHAEEHRRADLFTRGQHCLSAFLDR